MVTVRFTERRGRVLTPSALACLSSVPTVNVSCGCVHGCVYCYTRGYSQYPGEGTVLVYRDPAARVERELARKRRKPTAAYFCPSCDAFQPVEAVLEETYRTMRVLFEAGVGVEFVTKGAVPGRFLGLFSRHPGRVSAQVGVTTLDDSLRAALEPGAAPVGERLLNISRLTDAGVSVAVRADPLIYGVTDGDSGLAALMAACRERGVTDVAASYLFLRPAITAGLKRHVVDRELLERILAPYRHPARVRLRGGAGRVAALPLAVRSAAYDRLRALAEACGMTLRVCGCKNPDLTDERCQLTRTHDTLGSRGRSGPPRERLLWDAV
ncbi:MAG: radical SAM protein [Phycisphaerae bacterium]